jgi:hypothetical protein
MDDDDLVPIQDEEGRTFWVTRPPERCPQGHPWSAGNGGYGEGYYQCGCDGASSDGERPGHSVYTCKTCGDVTLVPACTDPDAKVGWGASHAH